MAHQSFIIASRRLPKDVLLFKRNTGDSEATLTGWSGTWGERDADMIRVDLTTAEVQIDTEG
ncbi:hypothetical protein N9153_03870 [Planctomicrobium sp.]|nr:hypothetical protein [Planctomicrobium sp.]MBT5018865.1 hypothetical protein [Planctomicrobium sp.]MDA7504063.1 hypothetical protein [bacterium]MDB4440040.1 hypothetical protein [Planctomicrobium sp.]